MSSLSGSSGWRTLGSSRSFPSYFGFQCSIITPFGTYTNIILTGVSPGALLDASAGVIASRKGSAIAVPIPLRIVLLGIAFRVIIFRLLRKSTTKKRRARRFSLVFLRVLRFFVVDFHSFPGATPCDMIATLGFSDLSSLRRDWHGRLFVTS